MQRKTEEERGNVCNTFDLDSHLGGGQINMYIFAHPTEPRPSCLSIVGPEPEESNIVQGYKVLPMGNIHDFFDCFEHSRVHGALLYIPNFVGFHLIVKFSTYDISYLLYTIRTRVEHSPH